MKKLIFLTMVLMTRVALADGMSVSDLKEVQKHISDSASVMVDCKVTVEESAMHADDELITTVIVTASNNQKTVSVTLHEGDDRVPSVTSWSSREVITNMQGERLDLSKELSSYALTLTDNTGNSIRCTNGVR